MSLEEFFAQNPKPALAFSGGADSSYLLYAAQKSGAKVKAYYVKSVFQPEFELNDAKRLARELNADMTVLPIDVLSCKEVADNPPQRCYYCKKRIFTTIARKAAEDGYELLIDGTNASDEAGERPGMRALEELKVRSPLKECGLTKEAVRRLSREAGLFTWDKPAYACLATRFPAGEALSADKLKKTEAAEAFLFSLGLSDFRIRFFKGAARLQLPEAQLETALAKRQEIVDELKQYYDGVFLDLEVRG